MREQRPSGTIKLRKRDDVSAGLRDGEDGVVDRRRATSDAERTEPTLQRGNTLLQHRVGWVADASVDVARYLQIEESGTVIGTIEFVGHSLINRHGDGVGRRLGLVAGMDRGGLILQVSALR